MPRDHPLLAVRRLTLPAIAQYPLISNGETSRLGCMVEDTFAAKGVQYDVAIRAMDTTAMKKFVELGLGVAVLPSIAVDPAQDAMLRAIPAGHLFKPGRVSAITLRDHAMPEYAREFVAVARAHGGGRKPAAA